MSTGTLIGKHFGQWTVVAKGESKHKSRYWIAKCDCGTIRQVSGGNLRTGRSTRCSKCQRLEAGKKGGRATGDMLKTHGHTINRSTTPTYLSWWSMNQRINNPNHQAYRHYGGRGLTICDRWASENPDGFINFLADLGERPAGATLDRIDPDLGYSPENCRWASKSVQSKNQRRWKRNVPTH